MNKLILFTLPLLFSAFSFAHDVCDQKVIRQAIEEAKSSKEATRLSQIAKQKIDRPARKNLSPIVQKLEKAAFGKKMFRIQEDLIFVPPMTSINADGIISMHPQTLDSLNKKLSKPTLGAAFIIAHEMAHFVQDRAFEKSDKKVSPHGIPYSNSDHGNVYNHLHSETDCIAIEILHQAGYPLTSDIEKTIQIITDECKTQRPASFCQSGDTTRKSAVQSYIRRFYEKEASPDSKAAQASERSPQFRVTAPTPIPVTLPNPAPTPKPPGGVR